MSINNTNLNQQKKAIRDTASARKRSLTGSTVVGVIAGSALAGIWLAQNGFSIDTSSKSGKNNVLSYFIGLSADSKSVPASSDPKPGAPFEQAANGVELKKLVTWEHEIRSEFERLSLKQQIHRVRNDILPELDRMENVLISSESTWKSSTWSKQLQVIDQIRSSFRDKLSELERQLHHHGGEK